NIELTNYTTQSDLLPEKVADLVNQFGLHDSILFSSFSKKTIRRIHALLPGVPVAMLATEGLLGAINRSSIGLKAAPDALHPHFSDVTPALVEKQHLLQRKVNVWTVNQEADIQRMTSWGVDGIITNDPILALQCREPLQPAGRETG
ncbi:MAG: glycerophosphodiester phosphodiesterase, partial [Anaerolineaceae bacterium]